MNPVFIKYKYELIDSTHILIVKSFSSYEASVCVGVFLKLTTGYQSKGSSIVESSNFSGGGTLHLPRAVSFLIFLIAQNNHHVQEVEPKVEPLEYQKN